MAIVEVIRRIEAVTSWKVSVGTSATVDLLSVVVASAAVVVVAADDDRGR